jgi:hypothetical protein
MENETGEQGEESEKVIREKGEEVSVGLLNKERGVTG